ncbi:hypothetical protein [Alkalibacillus silvisoli]|uniref:KTSC domain-containing protein n=1 Tax=Alkalibacillus silvisoli TaxID=392823 RepID=A0ABP3K226_9BACI
MTAIKSLLFVWKNHENNFYYQIGTLSYDGEVYTFEYSHKSESPRNVYEALSKGYRLHPAFPDLEKT